MNARLRRGLIGALSLALVASLFFAAVATAHTFFQRTKIVNAKATRNGAKVTIKGKLITVNQTGKPTSANRQYCTANRPIRATNLTTGQTKNGKTRPNGSFTFFMPLKKGKHANFLIRYAGRTGGTHPHRHVCGATKKKTNRV